MITPDQLLLAAACTAAGTTFAALAWVFVAAVKESSGHYAREMGEETSRQFADLFLFVSPQRIAELGRCGALAAFFICFIPLFSFTSALSTLAGIVLGLAAGAGVFACPARFVAFLRARRRRKFEEQLVEALGRLTNALRAGFSITQAIESVVNAGEAPLRQEFQVFLQQLRVGMNFDDALASLDRRVGSDDLTLVCSAIDIARRSGGNLTEILDRISETIRGRMRIARRVRALTAQGRLQGLVVSLMPLVLGLALTALKPALMLPFFLSFKGALCLGGVLVLEIVGWLVIRKIIRIDV